MVINSTLQKRTWQCEVHKMHASVHATISDIFVVIWSGNVFFLSGKSQGILRSDAYGSHESIKTVQKMFSF